MKHLFCILLFLLSLYSFSQTGLRVNGAKIIITTGAYVHIDGGSTADFTATYASSTEAKVDLDGTLKIDGDWVNNNSSTTDVLINQDGDGTIEFAGTSAQYLTGTATDDYTFEKMKVNSGAILILDADKSLTLGGDFNLSGYIRVKSNASGTGSFLDNGTITQTGAAHIERYVANEDKTHFVSPSVSDATGSQLINSKGNYNVYYFDPATSPYWFRVFGATSLNPGEGYTVVYDDTNTIYFKGDLNFGNISIAISDNNNEWNLVGNPYPSGLNASTFQTANAGGSTPSIYGTFYFWDESALADINDYASWNLSGSARGNGNSVAPNGYIGTGQGFWVKSKNKATNSISFTNAMREKNNTQFFLAEPELNQKLKISATAENGAFNEILLSFIEGASKGVDNLYDGHKLQGNPDLSFYSFITGNDEKFVIQGMPLLTKDEIIPLGIEITKDGEYVFKKELLENFETGTDIYFYDKLLDKYYDLNTTDEIKYNLEAGEINDRFEIRFEVEKTNIESKAQESEPTIYFNGKILVIETDGNLKGTVLLFDKLGKKLLNEKIENENYKTIEMDNAKGYYILSIITEEKVYNQKVFVK